MDFKPVVLLLFISLSIAKGVFAQNTMYKILDRDELNKLAKDKDSMLEEYYILDYNGVFVNLYRDGTAILLPPVLGGEEGLFFDDQKSMHEMIATHQFPVKPLGNFWESERDRMLNLNSEMRYYRDSLTKLLGFNVEEICTSDYLHRLSIALQGKLKGKKLSARLLNLIALHIADLLRCKIGGEWILFKEPAFNVYYVPRVAKDEKTFDVIGFVLIELDIAKFIPINVEQLLAKLPRQFVGYNRVDYIKPLR